jgi:hypothetical protein
VGIASALLEEGGRSQSVLIECFQEPETMGHICCISRSQADGEASNVLRPQELDLLRKEAQAVLEICRPCIKVAGVCAFCGRRASHLSTIFPPTFERGSNHQAFSKLANACETSLGMLLRPQCHSVSPPRLPDVRLDGRCSWRLA